MGTHETNLAVTVKIVFRKNVTLFQVFWPHNAYPVLHGHTALQYPPEGDQQVRGARKRGDTMQGICHHRQWTKRNYTFIPPIWSLAFLQGGVSRRVPPHPPYGGTRIIIGESRSAIFV